MKSGSLFYLFLFLLLLAPARAFTILWSETTYQDVTGLSISADGSAVVAAGGLVHYFTRDGGLAWKQWSVDVASISADGHYIGAAAQGSAMLIDKAGQRLWDQAIGGPVSGFSFATGGDELVVASDGRLYFFDNSGELLGTYPDTDHRPLSEDFVDVSTSANGWYTGAITGRSVSFYNRTGDYRWQELNNTLLEGRYVAVAPNGHELAAVGDAELFFLHSGGETLWTYGPNRDITAVAYAGDSLSLAIGTDDGRVIILSRDGNVRGVFQAQRRITEVSLSSNGSRILSSSWDGNVYYLAGNGTLLSTVNIGTAMHFAALSADGTWGAAATKVRVYYLSLSPDIPNTTVPSTTPTTVRTTPLPTTTLPATTLPATTVTTAPVSTTTAAGMPVAGTLGMIIMAILAVLWRTKTRR
jgi:WD40 repeat protein